MGGEDTTVIYVKRDVRERFEIIMSETQMNNNELLGHFFKLYDCNVQKIWNSRDISKFVKKEKKNKDKETSDKSNGSLSPRKADLGSPGSKRTSLKVNDDKEKLSEERKITLTLPESLLKKNVEIKVKSDMKYVGKTSVSTHKMEANRLKSPTAKGIQIPESVNDADPSEDDYNRISVSVHTSSEKSDYDDKIVSYEQSKVPQEMELDICVEDAVNTNIDSQAATTSSPLPTDDKKQINENSCKICNSQFETIHDLYVHMTVYHSETKQKKCFNCKQTKRTCKCEKINLDKINNQSQNQKYKCGICSQNYISDKSLNYHIMANHGNDSEEKTCFLCAKTFSNHFGYMYHIKNNHEEEELCKLCDVEVRNLDLRFGRSEKADMFSGDYDKRGKLYYCKHCEYKTDRATHIRRHMSNHLGKYIPCCFCESSFTNKYDLDTHIKVIHEQSLVLACDYCGKTFHNKDTLRSHRDRTHLKKYRIVCKICNKGFFQKGHYEGHLYKHDGIKRFKCEDCNKEFSYQAVLRRHRKTCTKNRKTLNKEPSVCHICGEKFKTIYGLKEHVEGKHYQKFRYQCICGSVYKWRGSFCHHKRRCQVLLQDSNKTTKIEIVEQNSDEKMNSSVRSDGETKVKGQDVDVHKQQIFHEAVNEVSTEHVMDQGGECQVRGQGFNSDITFNQVSLFSSKRKGISIGEESVSKGDNSNFTEKDKMVQDLNLTAKMKTFVLSDLSKNQCDLHFNSVESNLLRYGHFYSKNSKNMLQSYNYTKCQKCHNCLFIFSDIKVKEECQNVKRTVEKSSGKFQNKRIFRCRFCSKLFSMRIILKRHRKYCVKLNLLTAESFKCGICGLVFCKENNLQKHSLQNHGKRLLYRCRCGLIFKWCKSFNSHQENCLSDSKDTKFEFSKNKAFEMDSMIKKIYDLISSDFYRNEPGAVETNSQNQFLSENISPSSGTCRSGFKLTKDANTEGQQIKPVLNSLSGSFATLNAGDTTSDTTVYPLKENMDSGDCSHYSNSNLSKQDTSFDNHIHGANSYHSSIAQSDRLTSENMKDCNGNNSVTARINTANSELDKMQVDNGKRLGHEEQLHYKNVNDNQLGQSQTTFSKETVVINLADDTEKHHQNVNNRKLNDRFFEVDTESVVQSGNTGSCIDLTFSEEENSCHGSGNECDQVLQCFSSMKHNDKKCETLSRISKLQHNQGTSSVGNTLQAKVFKKRTNHYFCRFCNKYFLYKNIYQNHMKLHMEDRLLTSKHFSVAPSGQNQDFNSANTCAYNQQDQKHICTICGDTFRRIGSLKEHLSGVHGTIDRYQCRCGRSFKWRSSLGIHKQKCKESNNASSPNRFSLNQTTKQSKHFKKSQANAINDLKVNPEMQVYEETVSCTGLNEMHVSNMSENYEKIFSYNEEHNGTDLDDRRLTHKSADTIQTEHPAYGTTETFQSEDMPYHTTEPSQLGDLTYNTLGTNQSENEYIYFNKETNQSRHSIYFTADTSQSDDLSLNTIETSQLGNSEYNNAETTQLQQAGDLKKMPQVTEVFNTNAVSCNLGQKIKTEKVDLDETEYGMNVSENQNISIVHEKESENCSTYQSVQPLEIRNIVRNVSASFNMSGNLSQTDCTDVVYGSSSAYSPSAARSNSALDSVTYEQPYYLDRQIYSGKCNQGIGQNSSEPSFFSNSYLDRKYSKFQPNQAMSILSIKKKLSANNFGVGEFKCKLCGDTFTLKGSLREHELGKHGDPNRYKCICGMNFKWRSSLSLHVKKCKTVLGVETDSGFKYENNQY